MDDGPDPVARNLQDIDPIEHAFPGGAATFASELPVLCQRRLLPVAATPGGHEKIGAGILSRHLPGRPGARFSCCSIVWRRFWIRWKRSATCRAFGAPRRVPSA
jgi:hypothetical protein